MTTSNNVPILVDAPEGNFKKAEELLTYLKGKTRSEQLVDNFGNIKFSQDSTDGKLLLDAGVGKLPFTEAGFTRFCKLLRVPNKFILNLPFDNIVKDLTASLYKTDLKKLNFIVQDQQIIGVSPRETTISTLEVVEKIFETTRTVRDIGITKNELHLAFTSDEMAAFKDDQIDAGLSIIHNESSGDYPTLNYYFWRQVCSNGAVARTLEKIAKFSSRMAKDKMLEVFNERVNQNLSVVNSTLLTALQNMKNKTIERDEKKYLKGFIGRKLDFTNHTDGTTRFDTEIGGKEDASYYDLMNFITDFAKNFAIEDKANLERLGGNMVAHFKDVKPSLDVFSGYTEYKRKKVYKELIDA